MALPKRLAVERNPEVRALRPITDHYRQYVGVVRMGRRFIYGNLFPRTADGPSHRWLTEPVLVCDGGPTFFGVEWDVQAGQFSHLAFNGPA